MPTAKKVHSDRDQIAQKNSDSSINTDGSNGSAVVEAKSLSDSSTSNNPESKNNTSVSKTDQDDVSAVRTTVITTESRNNKSHQSRGRHSSGSSGNNGGNSGTTNSSGNSKFFTGETIKVEGVLELFTDYGVIRQDIADTGDNDLPKDVYTSLSQIKRFSLRMGDLVEGYARAPKEGERYLSLLQIEKVGGLDPSEAKKRPRFSKLTPIFPDEWMKLETAPEILSTRIIDLVSP
ncbi:MAG TPA: hypothetical protein PLF29_03450, partial [bacterium]|nr:hypothetical protein [bacterium]